MSHDESARRTVGLGALAAFGGFVATCVTAAVCALPLAAIGLGVGGLGWLTQYLHLRVPAALATAALLGLGFHLVYRRGAACQPGARRRTAKALLWAATAFAAAIHGFEFLVLPFWAETP
jgi:hypothetical protein